MSTRMEDIDRMVAEFRKNGSYYETAVLCGVTPMTVRKYLVPALTPEEISELRNQRKARKTEERLSQIRELHLAGASTKFIAKQLRLNRATVNRMISSVGLAKKRKRRLRFHVITDKNISMIQDYLDGMNLRQLSEKYGVTRSGVSGFMKYHGFCAKPRTHLFSNEQLIEFSKQGKTLDALCDLTGASEKVILEIINDDDPEFPKKEPACSHLNFNVPVAVDAALRESAKKYGTTLSGLIREIVTNWVNTLPPSE